MRDDAKIHAEAGQGACHGYAQASTAVGVSVAHIEPITPEMIVAGCFEAGRTTSVPVSAYVVLKIYAAMRRASGAGARASIDEKVASVLQSPY